MVVDLGDIDTLLLNLCRCPPLTVLGSAKKSGNKASREAFVVGRQTLREIALVSIALDGHEILAELAALRKLVPCHSDDVDVEANRQASRSDASVELAQDQVGQGWNTSTVGEAVDFHESSQDFSG